MFLNGCADNWFAVQVRPRREFWVSSLLTNKGYKTYTPCYHDEGHRKKLRGKNALPLLPGYVFCQFNSSLKAPIVTTPGVVRIVGFGKTPIAVSPAELENIFRVEQHGEDVQPHPFLTVGQRVRVADGPLAGVEGIVMVAKGRGRLLLSVNLIQRSLCVQLQGYRVKPIPAAS